MEVDPARTHRRERRVLALAAVARAHGIHLWRCDDGSSARRSAPNSPPGSSPRQNVSSAVNLPPCATARAAPAERTGRRRCPGSRSWTAGGGSHRGHREGALGGPQHSPELVVAVRRGGVPGEPQALARAGRAGVSERVRDTGAGGSGGGDHAGAHGAGYYARAGCGARDRLHHHLRRVCGDASGRRGPAPVGDDAAARARRRHPYHRAQLSGSVEHDHGHERLVRTQGGVRQGRCGAPESEWRAGVLDVGLVAEGAFRVQQGGVAGHHVRRRLGGPHSVRGRGSALQVDRGVHGVDRRCAQLHIGGARGGHHQAAGGDQGGAHFGGGCGGGVAHRQLDRVGCGAGRGVSALWSVAGGSHRRSVSDGAGVGAAAAPARQAPHHHHQCGWAGHFGGGRVGGRRRGADAAVGGDEAGAGCGVAGGMVARQSGGCDWRRQSRAVREGVGGVCARYQRRRHVGDSDAAGDDRCHGDGAGVGAVGSGDAGAGQDAAGELDGRCGGGGRAGYIEAARHSQFRVCRCRLPHLELPAPLQRQPGEFVRGARGAVDAGVGDEGGEEGGGGDVGAGAGQRPEPVERGGEQAAAAGVRDPGGGHVCGAQRRRGGGGGARYRLPGGGEAVQQHHHPQVGCGRGVAQSERARRRAGGVPRHSVVGAAAARRGPLSGCDGVPHGGSAARRFRDPAGQRARSAGGPGGDVWGRRQFGGGVPRREPRHTAAESGAGTADDEAHSRVRGAARGARPRGGGHGATAECGVAFLAYGGGAAADP
eukprot:ctg_73.g10